VSLGEALHAAIKGILAQFDIKIKHFRVLTVKYTPAFIHQNHDKAERHNLF